MGDRHGPGSREGCLALKAADPIALQQACDAVGQLFGNCKAVSHNLREIHMNILGCDAQRGAPPLQFCQQFSTVQQTFGGNAAYIQASAAQILLFHKGHLRAQLRCADRGTYPPGPPPTTRIFSLIIYISFLGRIIGKSPRWTFSGTGTASYRVRRGSGHDALRHIAARIP